MSEEKAKAAKSPETRPASNFIKDFIDEDLKNGKNQGRLATRFPPEPNGYLHIGHAKSICLNFGLAREYGGTCNLRFDDTNPTKEDVEYVESIMEDIHWLGFDWGDRLYYASDYFETLYELALKLIRKGKAYADGMSEEEIREYRGNYYKKAKESRDRNRSVEENLDLFQRMRDGEFKDGELVLRAKIDMTASNMNLRDPIMYRIRHAAHHRTGNKWCIYPMYDWAHGQSDALEKITHSLCSLEFQNHRPLYDWFTKELEFEDPPRQIEFARLNLNYTVMSKRKFLELVEGGYVAGWDDPRMPTISGLRRRGYTPESIRKFSDMIGVAKADSVVDMALLEYCIREDLNDRAPRMMAVLNPLKVVITNYPEGRTEEFEGPYHPEDPSMGSRRIPFGRELYVERDDFREEAPRKWHRLAPGKEVRLRYACLVTCREVIKDADGNVIELRCTWDPDSKGGTSPDGRKVKGTLHWVSAAHAVDAEVRLYDRLFQAENPLAQEDGRDWKDTINPESLLILKGCKLEPALAEMQPGGHIQFERLGYFCADRKDFRSDSPVFNRTATLRDTWAKIEQKQAKAEPEPKAPKQEKAKKAVPGEIDIKDFQKMDLRVGRVKSAELVEGADKLLRILVDLGEEKPRQIFSGIRAEYPDPSVLVGRQVMVIANLKPRKMKFGLSEGMILGAGGDDRFRLATFDGDLKPGDKVS